MLFNSSEFLVFFPVVVCMYFLLPHRFRWVLLLAASYYFYMCWRAEYVLLIIASTLIDYFAAIQMAAARSRTRRRMFLGVSLAANLGLLFFFKYFTFFNESMRDVFMRFNIMYDVPVFKVLLPVGISFYTFQTLSYSIDVYRGERKPEKHLGIFALYVAFFPQLVAGPIERSIQLLPQFFEKHGFSYPRIVSGLRLMLWGAFKKIVIADRLAAYVNTVYNDPGSYQGPHLVFATYLFAFQIFCDFSGYSDMAIGAARVMGFRLMKNFNSPYFSRSVREFWRRWHISLSTWFRDYLYIPLGGNRGTVTRVCINLGIVFLLTGLWHGANWTFLVWGVIHGFYLICSVAGTGIRKRMSRYFPAGPFPHIGAFVKRIYVFNLVAFAWIFFRAGSLHDAFLICSRLFSGWSGAFSGNAFYIFPGLSVFYLITTLGMVALMETVHALQLKYSLPDVFGKLPVPLRWGAYTGVVYAILLFGFWGQIEFIYFQF